MSITNGRVMFVSTSRISISAVTFTRIAPLSNLTKASSKHATHGSKSVPLAPGGPCVPLAPGRPCVPLAPAGPAGPCGPCGPAGPIGPCGPGGPCGPVLLSLSLSLNLCFASQNSTELTKKPSNGPVLHSYFLSLVLYSL